MSIEQKIRGLLFYLSAAVFLFTLPLILSFALGYKFDKRYFKFAKTGLIVLKTQPSGATVYFQGKPLGEKTPVTIQELLPGEYDLSIELEEHYAWSGRVRVEGGKVSRLEKIILFPLRPDIKKISQAGISTFCFDHDRAVIYYLLDADNCFYRSGANAASPERVSGPVAPLEKPLACRISPDNTKIVYFNQRQLGLAYLEQNSNRLPRKPSFIFSCNFQNLINVFWHSDSYHVILMDDRSIKVIEANPQASPIIVTKLIKKDSIPYYDSFDDMLYFIDSQPDAEGHLHDSIYKLDLNIKVLPFEDLLRIKTNERNKAKKNL
jgi:hypothetical protein